MTPIVEAGLGLAILMLGWLIGRWAGRYDIKSWFTSALWRAIFRQGWRKPVLKGDLGAMLEADPELKRTISGKARDFKADTARIGATRATVKHAGLFGLAYAMSFLVMPLMIVGGLVIAHAAWRWLG